MAILTLECWSRHRVEYLSVLLASLHNQTFQDWDIVILEEADCNYLGNPVFVGLLKRLKNQGHRVIFLHPREMLGNVRAAVTVMKETKTKYAMKLDDDHLFEMDALEKLVNVLEENEDIGAVGGMLHPITEELIPRSEIPPDFNRWTGPKKRTWNDYTTLVYSFPEQIVEVDFVRAPFMYRADKLRETNWIDLYPTLGYSDMAHRIESEICNTLKKEFGYRIAIHTGVRMWHYLAPTGGCRMIDPRTREHDDEIYYSRWKEFHE